MVNKRYESHPVSEALKDGAVIALILGALVLGAEIVQ